MNDKNKSNNSGIALMVICFLLLNVLVIYGVTLYFSIDFKIMLKVFLMVVFVTLFVTWFRDFKIKRMEKARVKAEKTKIQKQKEKEEQALRERIEKAKEVQRLKSEQIYKNKKKKRK